jgi:hypothetical protein
VTHVPTGATTGPARLGRTPDDYARIGIAPRAIKPWEDGMRTHGSPGTYEWWYFDPHLDDGAKLVVVFLTKKFTPCPCGHGKHLRPGHRDGGVAVSPGTQSRSHRRSPGQVVAAVPYDRASDRLQVAGRRRIQPAGRTNGRWP